MAVTQYIGARYVPIFADPTEWTNTKQYEPLTIVTYQGASYTSKQFVPIGVEITNENYWALTGNYNAQIDQYRNEVDELTERVDLFIGRTFNTIADAIVGAIDYEIGDTISTLGAMDYRDGIQCIFTVDAENMGLGTVTPSGKWLNPVASNGTLNAYQIGMRPDETFDCKDYLENFLRYASDYGATKLFVPVGQWYMSPTLLAGSEYAITIQGENGFFSRNTVEGSTIFLPIGEQEYVLKLGGSRDAHELSVNFTSKLYNFTMNNIVFRDTRKLARIQLCMCLCCYSSFDYITIWNVRGTAIKMALCWEDVFGTTVVRAVYGMDMPCVHFAKAPSIVSSQTVYPTISSVVFDLFHMETLQGNAFEFDDHCYAVNVLFNMISCEDAAPPASYYTTETFSKENIQEGDIPFYFMYGNCRNVFINAFNFTHGDYVRKYFYSDGEHRYYYNALFANRFLGGNTRAHDQYDLTVNGNIRCNDKSSKFILFYSEGYLVDEGVFGGKVSISNNNNANIFDVRYGGLQPTIDYSLSEFETAKLLYNGNEYSALCGYTDPETGLQCNASRVGTSALLTRGSIRHKTMQYLAINRTNSTATLVLTIYPPNGAEVERYTDSIPANSRRFIEHEAVDVNEQTIVGYNFTLRGATTASGNALAVFPLQM